MAQNLQDTKESSQRIVKKMALIEMVPSLIDVLDSLDMMFVLLEQNGDVMYVNQEALNWFGGEFKDYYGYNFNIYLTDYDRTRAQYWFQQALEHPLEKQREPYLYKHNVLNSNEYFFAEWTLVWLPESKLFLATGYGRSSI